MADRALPVAQETGVPGLLGRSETGRATKWLRALWNFTRRKPLGAFGALLLLIMVFCAITAEIVSPYDPLAVHTAVKLTGPSWTHPFGTDNLGRDMLSRIIYGARPSLYTGLSVVAISSFLGLMLGVVSAYFGGTFDLLVQRFVDGLIAFPGIVFAMAVLSVFSNGIRIWVINWPLVWHSTPLAVVGTLSILLIPGTSRVVRSSALGIINNQYVEAAKATGAGSSRIVWRHLVPNVMAPLIVIASAQLGSVILIEAALSFLGLGIPPPTPEWGAMLQGTGRQFMEVAPWLAIFPGLAISVGVLGFNLFGDALRDIMDPRLRGTSGPAH